MSKLYLAYGANTNRDHMRRRCPAAQYICNLTVPDHQLIFRGVADVVYAPGRETQCALWLITPKCEAALDAFEGFPYGYTKKYINIELDDRRHRAMLYVMTVQRRRGQHEPYPSYEECLREGYADCGLPGEQIDEAIALVGKWHKRASVIQRAAARQARGGKSWEAKNRRSMLVDEFMALDPEKQERVLEAALRSIADAS